jgi:hypothetical protein
VHKSQLALSQSYSHSTAFVLTSQWAEAVIRALPFVAITTTFMPSLNWNYLNVCHRPNFDDSEIRDQWRAR